MDDEVDDDEIEEYEVRNEKLYTTLNEAQLQVAKLN